MLHSTPTPRAIVMLQWLIPIALFLTTTTNAQRVAGIRGAVADNVLWLYGGAEVQLDGTISSHSPIKNLTVMNLTHSCSTTARPESFGPQSEVPGVSYGTLWGNGIDKIWLYGGNTSEMYQDQNTVHSFDTARLAWSESLIAGATSRRAVEGAGISVPSISRAYYIGGYSPSRTGYASAYYHSMAIFDMTTETMTFLDIPQYVPIIGSSVIYLDTAVTGLLAVVGGKTERNGTIAYASLARIYIFDIKTSKWMIQPTTDTLGRSDHFYGAYNLYDSGIPNERRDMCVVAAASSDASSFNLYLFGGRNETDTMGDIWALSMPSAMWIRMNTSDTTNNPKTGGSCNLINNRLAIMFGGCWMEGNNKCLSYGWNPLLYDITIGDWNWSYDPVIQNGYSVPRQIFQAIGGNSSGYACAKSPNFTRFGDPMLDSRFHPKPSGTITNCYLTLKVLLPVLLVICLTTSTTQFILKYRNNGMLGSGSEVAKLDKDRTPWRPYVLTWAFLTFLTASTSSLVVVVLVLYYLSTRPDSQTAHWVGGLESSGIWTATHWNTTFTPGPASGKPFRGLLSFYLDTHTTGQWNQHDATQRLGIGPYILWTYVPSIVTVFHGVLWQVVDGEVKRIEKYRRLARPEGTPAKRSICFDYHSFWGPLAIFQGLRYRQWAVALSSTGYVFAAIVVPNVQNYTFAWVIFSGSDLEWGQQSSWQIAYMDPYWSMVLFGVLAANLACAIGLVVLTAMTVTGLTENPRGIAYLASLIIDKEIRENMQNHFTLSQQPRLKNSNQVWKLQRDNAHACLTLATSTSAATVTTPPRRRWQKIRAVLVVALQKISQQLDRIETVLAGQRASIFIDVSLLLLWNSVLIVLLAGTAHILSQMTSNRMREDKNYRLPWSPNLYLIVGVFVQSFYQVLEKRVRATVVLEALQQRYQHPQVLYEDWENTLPVLDVAEAFWYRHNFLGYILLGTVSTIVYTIMLGSLQVSASFYGATTFAADTDGVIVVMVVNMYLLVISLAALWRYWQHKIWKLPRQGTVAELLPFLLESDNLAEDMKSVQEQPHVKDRIASLDSKSARYGLLHVATESKLRGVERHQ